MAKYKTLVLSIILILEVIILIPFLTRGVKKTISDVFPELKGELKAEFGLRGVRSFGISNDHNKYKLEMERASYYQLTHEISGDTFVGTLIDPAGKSTQIESSIIFYNVASQKIAIPTPGKIDMQKDGKILFSNLIYEKKDENFYCTKGATFYYPNEENPQVIAKGDNIVLSKATRIVTINEDFQVDYMDQKNSDSNFNVQSEYGTIDMVKNHVTFNQNVIMKQQKFRLKSDKLDVQYEKGKKNSGVALANGNVEINDIQFDRRAFSQQALYNQNTNEITLMGLPVVEQGEDKLAGELIKINKNNDYIEVINASAKIQAK